MITVIGLGFVGLTTALGFCSKGYKVYGIEIDKTKLNLIKGNKIPFLEPHLEDALQEYNGNIFFPTDNLKEAVENSEYIFLCVGTPCDTYGAANLSYIFRAIQDTVRFINKNIYKVLIIKSTVPPSSTKEKIKPFIENLGFIVGENIGLVSNPEFLREGYSWKDFINPDRVVIGQLDEKSGLLVENLYKVFNAPTIRVSLNTAEFIKYLSNTLLAAMISFSNDMSICADTIGDINISKAFRILHMDKRWYGNPAAMKNYIYPGCGFGGYCLPKDTQALYSQTMEKGYKSTVLESILNVNEKIKEYIVDKILKETKKGDYIGILGLAFKPDSDDVRETPSKYIIDMLLQRGYRHIVVYDPNANSNFAAMYNLPIEYEENMIKVVNKAENIIILTAWDEFKENRDLLLNKKIFDFRYIL